MACFEKYSVYHMFIPDLGVSEVDWAVAKSLYHFIISIVHRASHFMDSEDPHYVNQRWLWTLLKCTSWKSPTRSWHVKNKFKMDGWNPRVRFPTLTFRPHSPLMTPSRSPSTSNDAMRWSFLVGVATLGRNLHPSNHPKMLGVICVIWMILGDS